MPRKPGFSLVEILVVTIIMSILVAIMLPAINLARRHALDSQCHLNLKNIGLALATYRQDNNAYPQRGGAIGAVCASASKSLRVSPTCPKDPQPNNSTYDDWYNYWGYTFESAPSPYASSTDAANAYVKLQSGTGSILSNKGVWQANQQYSAGITSVDMVSYPTGGPSYICKVSHQSLPQGNTPGVSAGWMNYWQPLPRLWRTDKSIPDSDFPGLANANCPGTTIVTACPHHIDSGNYMILRANGVVDFIAVPTGDVFFWAMSHPAI